MMTNPFDFLKDVEPEKVVDGFEPFKGNYECNFNYARIEDYQGDKEEFKGEKFFRYELEVAATQQNAGRRVWASIRFSDETRVKKLRNMIFTVLGENFSNPDELIACAEKLVEKTVLVRCWMWTPPDADAPIQLHQIKKIMDDLAPKKTPEIAF